MEYIFGYEPRYGEVLKVKDPTNVTLHEGQNIVERTYSDQIITDGFYVGKRIRSKEDSAGNKYAWYMISHHYRYTDKFTPGIKPVIASVDETQDALCEASEDFEQRIADIEDALCELTEGGE